MAICGNGLCPKAAKPECVCACSGLNHPGHHLFRQSLHTEDGTLLAPTILRHNPDPGAQSDAETVALVVYVTVREALGLIPLFESITALVRRHFKSEGWVAGEAWGSLGRVGLGLGDVDDELGMALHLRQMYFAAIVRAMLACDAGASHANVAAAAFSPSRLASLLGTSDTTEVASAERAIQHAADEICDLLGANSGDTLRAGILLRLIAIVFAVNLTHEACLAVTDSTDGQTRRSSFTPQTNSLAIQLANDPRTFALALELRSSRQEVRRTGRRPAIVPADCDSLPMLSERAFDSANFAVGRLDALISSSGLDGADVESWLHEAAHESHLWCNFFMAATAALNEVDKIRADTQKVVAERIAQLLAIKFPKLPKPLIFVIASFVIGKLFFVLGGKELQIARHVCAALAIIACPNDAYHDNDDGGNELVEVCLVPLFKDYATTIAKAQVKTRVDDVVAVLLAEETKRGKSKRLKFLGTIATARSK
jgi:hypothetical protein